jgi:hypothetical protein
MTIGVQNRWTTKLSIYNPKEYYVALTLLIEAMPSVLHRHVGVNIFSQIITNVDMSVSIQCSLSVSMLHSHSQRYFIHLDNLKINKDKSKDTNQH